MIQSKGQQYEPHPFDLLSLHPRSINPLLLEMTTDTPRTDAYQYADYILNHYDRGSHEDKLCLAKSLIDHGYGRSASKAEVERLEEKLKHAVYLLKSYNPSYSDLFAKEFK